MSDEKDAQILNQVQDRFEVNITELPDEIDVTTYSKYTNVFVYKVYYTFESWWALNRTQRGTSHSTLPLWALSWWLGAE